MKGCLSEIELSVWWVGKVAVRADGCQVVEVKCCAEGVVWIEGVVVVVVVAVWSAVWWLQCRLWWLVMGCGGALLKWMDAN